MAIESVRQISLLMFLEIDECSQNTHTCDQNAHCTNTAGSYACQCQTGYKGDGQTCAIGKY